MGIEEFIELKKQELVRDLQKLQDDLRECSPDEMPKGYPFKTFHEWDVFFRDGL